MSKIEELKKRGELIVEAPLQYIAEAARIALGVAVKEVRENKEIIYTYESPVCPPRIIVKEIEPGKYHVTSSSKCTIPDCPYWEKCARVDSERLRIFEIALDKIFKSKEKRQEG